MTIKKGQITLRLKVDKAIEKEFEALPPTPLKNWTPEGDEMIRQHWKARDQVAFTEMFGKKFFKVGLRTLATRARALGV